MNISNNNSLKFILCISLFFLAGCSATTGKRMLSPDGVQSAAAFGEYGSMDAQGKDAVEKEIISYLSSSDAKTKANAASVAGQLKISGASEDLRALLSDKNSNVRAAAATALGNLEDTQSASKLVGMLADSDSQVRACAAYALGNLKYNDAVVPLLNVLSDPDANTANAAVEALDKIGLEPALLISLGENSNPNIRMYAVHALCKADPQTDETFAALQNRLKDEEPQIAQYTMNKIRLANIPVKYLTQLLRSEDAELKILAIDKLGTIGSEARPALSVLARNLLNADDTIAQATSRALGSIGKDSIPMLSLYMKRNNARAKEYATKAYGYMGEEGLPHLVRFMGNTDVNVRKNAAHMLGELGPLAAGSADVLFKALKDANADVRLESLEALDKIGFEQTEENRAAIERLTEDIDETVAQKAKQILEGGPSLQSNEPLAETSVEGEPQFKPVAAAQAEDVSAPAAQQSQYIISSGGIISSRSIASEPLPKTETAVAGEYEVTVSVEDTAIEPAAELFPNGKRTTKPARRRPQAQPAP